jgi:hypothetical protein
MQSTAVSRRYWLGEKSAAVARVTEPRIDSPQVSVHQRDNIGIILHTTSGINNMRQEFRGESLNIFECMDPQDPPIAKTGLRLTRASGPEGINSMRILRLTEGRYFGIKLEAIRLAAAHILKQPDSPIPVPDDAPLATVHYIGRTIPEDSESEPDDPNPRQPE